MISSELHHFRRKAEAYFKHSFQQGSRYEMVEDFGSYCVEKWMSGRSVKTSFKFLAVDFLRLNGVKIDRNGKADALNQTQEEIDADVLNNVAFSCNIDIKSEAMRDERLTKEQRAILILYFEWGLDLKEIGDVFGIGESAVSQTLKKTLGEVTRRLKCSTQ